MARTASVVVAALLWFTVAAIKPGQFFDLACRVVYAGADALWVCDGTGEYARRPGTPNFVHGTGSRRCGAVQRVSVFSIRFSPPPGVP